MLDETSNQSLTETSNSQSNKNQQLNKSCNVATFGQNGMLDFELPPQEQFAEAAKHLNMSSAHRLYAGFYLLNLKETLPHGEFEKGKQKAGFEKTKAARLMRNAEFIRSLPEEKRLKIAKLPFTKVIEFAKADPEVIEDLMADDEGFEEVRHLSVRELRRAVQSKQAEINELTTKNKTLSNRLKFKAPTVDTDGGQYGQEVDEAQLASMQYFKQIDIAVGQIHALRMQHNERLYDKSQQGEIERKKVARAIYRATASAASQVLDLLKTLEAESFNDIEAPFDITERLNEEQTERFLSAAKALVEDQESVNRKIKYQAYNNRPTGKGRPPKV